jgi:Ca-activated chloride channel family protein
MMEWTHPEILWLLIALPFVLWGLLYKIRQKRKTVQEVWREGKQAEKTYKYRSIQAILITFSFAFMLLALANPRQGDQPISRELEKAEIILAIDISRSMLAVDVQPNRLTIAKNLCMELIKELQFERIGSIVFAGNAYVNMPLTNDVSALPTFIQNISVETAGTQGTAIGEAIQLAYGSFSNNEPEGKQLVILSDGEDHEQNAMDQAEQAFEAGMIIHTVGIGTSKGSRIPLPNGGQNRFLRDKDNNEVVSRLKEDLLQDIAQAAGGQYFKYESLTKTTAKLAKHVKSKAERSVRTTQYKSYVYYYSYALIAAFSFLVAAIWIQWRKI